MRRLYTLLLAALTPLVLARLFVRSLRAPAYRRRIAERFGRFERRPPPGGIWVHAVSLGETRAALPLIRALRARHPGRALIVTTTTPTGSRQVLEALGDEVFHVYAPYDLPWAVAAFLRRARPALALVMETELWPNLFAACAADGIPLVVANARLSERSARGYGRLRGLTRATLAHAALVAAQAEADAARFRALGAPRVEVLGNLKFDLAVPAGLAARGAELRAALGWTERPVLIAASTHAGEDERVLDAFARLRVRLPEVGLILVPRHPERFDAVAALLASRGLAAARRSRGAATAAEVYLGDTLGELLLLFAAADVAFVGGSLVPTGGHNVLEPAALGLPVLFGPHMFNFAEAERLLCAAGAARRVADAAELSEAAAAWLEHPTARRAAGERGRAVVEAERGALERLLARIEELLLGDE